MLKAGQRLKDERIKKGLAIDEVSKITKIRKPFLLSIERGDYQKLPSGAYVLGFVRNYARFLGLKEEEILAIFRREFSQEKVAVLPEGLTREEIPLRSFRFNQGAKIIILFFLTLLFYLLFQYRYAIINPPLTVFAPDEGSVVSSQTITIFGKTDPNATVFVNNDPVSLETDGSFKKVLALFSGKSTITIKSINRFGRQTTIERHIEVK